MGSNPTAPILLPLQGVAADGAVRQTPPEEDRRWKMGSGAAS
ncbi:MAG: hypothetical protein NTZ01_03705 [Verrucomicrobia bacterium]|nr:hypothetical protein [Verrucomicrobiota bacterium]